jgi:hypothetical protein
VIAAALLALPAVALGLAGAGGALTAGLVWSVWCAFLLDAVVMLAVARDRLGWAAGHWFELLVLVVAFPPLVELGKASESLEAVPVLELAKSAKLAKSLRVLVGRSRRTRTGLRRPREG